jgi:predicted TPR repeat methyltransferase
MSVLAAYVELDGDHKAAIELYKKAVRLAPRSKGAWYRYVRSVMRIPAKPPL